MSCLTVSKRSCLVNRERENIPSSYLSTSVLGISKQTTSALKKVLQENPGIKLQYFLLVHSRVKQQPADPSCMASKLPYLSLRRATSSIQLSRLSAS